MDYEIGPAELTARMTASELLAEWRDAFPTFAGLQGADMIGFDVDGGVVKKNIATNGNAWRAGTACGPKVANLAPMSLTTDDHGAERAAWKKIFGSQVPPRMDAMQALACQPKMADAPLRGVLMSIAPNLWVPYAQNSDIPGIERAAALPKPTAPKAEPPSTIKPAISGLHVLSGFDHRLGRWGA